MVRCNFGLTWLIVSNYRSIGFDLLEAFSTRGIIWNKRVSQTWSYRRACLYSATWKCMARTASDVPWDGTGPAAPEGDFSPTAMAPLSVPFECLYQLAWLTPWTHGRLGCISSSTWARTFIPSQQTSSSYLAKIATCSPSLTFVHKIRLVEETNGNYSLPLLDF